VPKFDLAVVGVGYAGLPLLVAAARKGLKVVGQDRNPDRIAALLSGVSYIDDVPNADVTAVATAGGAFVTDSSLSCEADTILIAVSTPLDLSGQPDLRDVCSATQEIARSLRPGTLVIMASTSYPGTTDGVVRTILETSGLRAGKDFALAYSPERSDPGNDVFSFSITPRVVAGLTPDCAKRARDFMAKLVTDVVEVDGLREAELSKLIENTYRQVNIAFVNELLQLGPPLGVDVWKALRAAGTKPFGFQAFEPGPGVGGHCIPVDARYLLTAAQSAGVTLSLVEAAQSVNDRMPCLVVNRVAAMLDRTRTPMHQARVLLLGVTYKANVGDDRNRPSRAVADELVARGADVDFHDPFHEKWLVGDAMRARVPELGRAISEVDAVVLLQAHRCYLDDPTLFDNARLLLDTRSVLSNPRADRL